METVLAAIAFAISTSFATLADVCCWLLLVATGCSWLLIFAARCLLLLAARRDETKLVVALFLISFFLFGAKNRTNTDLLGVTIVAPIVDGFWNPCVCESRCGIVLGAMDFGMCVSRPA